jgi:hypothetical protein
MAKEAIQRMKWKELKRLVIDNYCPASELGSMEKEFVNLKAGTMTHQEYTRKFNKMAQLLLDMEKPKSRIIERYVSGLQIDIRQLVLAARPATF